jgi:hypothetical protein
MEKIIEQGIESHEEMIKLITLKHFNESPKSIIRMTTGACNEVYSVELLESEVIVRLSAVNYFLQGSHNHIPILRNLSISVPDILAEDYSKQDIPFAYQFLSKIPGKDLLDVIQDLNDSQLKLIASEISNVFTKVRTLPSINKFGYVYGGYEELNDTWMGRIKDIINEATERSRQTGILKDDLLTILQNIITDNEKYFNQVVATPYIDDICSKNVMINNGTFSGLVDLDCVAYGDPLETIGRIKASWLGTHYGEVYTEAVMEAQSLNAEQRKMVSVYALLNRISWATENGIQFNQNTKAVVDEEKLKRDAEAIDILLEGCYEFN